MMWRKWLCESAVNFLPFSTPTGSGFDKILLRWILCSVGFFEKWMHIKNKSLDRSNMFGNSLKNDTYLLRRALTIESWVRLPAATTRGIWRLVIHPQEHINGVFRAGEELNMSRNYDDQLLYMSDFSFLSHWQISNIFNYFGVRWGYELNPHDTDLLTINALSYIFFNNFGSGV